MILKKKTVNETPVLKKVASDTSEQPKQQPKSNITQATNIPNTPQPKDSAQPTDTIVDKAPAEKTHYTADAEKENKKSLPKSISIKNFKKQIAHHADNATDAQMAETQNIAITEDMVIKCWQEFAKTMDSSSGTRIFLQTHLPTLVDAHTILVEVDNRFQQKELAELEVINYLREKLHNSLVSLSVKVLPESEQVKHLSPQEVLTKMMQENTSVKELVNRLKLEID